MRGVGGQAGRRPRGTTEAGGTATARDQGSARDGVGNAGSGGRRLVAGEWQPRGPLDIDTLILTLTLVLPLILMLMFLLGRDAAGAAGHNNQLGLG